MDIPRDDYRALAVIAGTPYAQPQTWTDLAQHEHWEVRQAVASRPDCPPELLRQLGQDGAGIVRETVASHPSCPLHTLEQLLCDHEYPPAARAAFDNPNLPTALRAMWQLAHGKTQP